MYLTRLLLNSRSRLVQREMGNLYELHRTLMSAFADGVTRQDAAMLYRLERHMDDEACVSVLVQSALEPSWEALQSRNDYLAMNGWALKDLSALSGLQGSYRFYLRANPTRRLSESRRLVPILSQEQQVQWLADKGEKHGFAICSQHLLLRKMPPYVMFKGGADKKMRIEIQAVDFSGVLEVKDPDRFRSAWQAGIGRGRSFGCGLLSLARL